MLMKNPDLKLVIGYDTEYQLSSPPKNTDKSGKRKILSYQLALSGNSYFSDASKIYYCHNSKQRSSLASLLSKFLSNLESLPGIEPCKPLFSYGYSRYEVVKVKNFLSQVMSEASADVTFWKFQVEFVAKLFVSTGFTFETLNFAIYNQWCERVLDLRSDLTITTSGGIISPEIFIKFSINFVKTKLLEHEKRVRQGKTLYSFLKESEKVVIYFGSHFNIVDLTAFLDFQKILKGSDSIGKVQVSVEKPYLITLTSPCGKYFLPVVINFRDTTMLSGGGSLKDLASSIGMEKLDLKPAEISNMGLLLKENPARFEEYALNDAVIVAKYLYKFIEKYGFVPSTIGALSAFRLKKAVMTQNNFTNQQFLENWQGLKSRKTSSREELPLDEQIGQVLLLAKKAYKGGRNESFCHGRFKGLFNDYDLEQAYAISMLSCGTPDWEQLKNIYQVEEIIGAGSSYVIASVEFKFPNNCKVPCLPHLDKYNRGLIFPLEGEGVFCKHELQLALELGASMRIKGAYSWILPVSDLGLQPEVVLMIKERLEAQEGFGKGSFEEKFLKLMINSSYGKVGQGLKEKKKYSTRAEDSVLIKTSSITSAVIAAHITDVVRTMVSAAASTLMNKNKKVLSITTDGLMTDGTKEDLENDFTITKEFKIWASIAGINDIWGLKHQNLGHVELKTRGSFGLKDGPEARRHFALAGLYLTENQREMSSNDRTEFLLGLYEKYVVKGKRIPNTQASFPSTREIQKGTKEAGIKESRKVNLSWNYDWKRNLINSKLDTKPWKTWRDFHTHREWLKEFGHQDAATRRELVNIVIKSGDRNVCIRKDFEMELRKVVVRLALRNLIKIPGEDETKPQREKFKLLAEIMNWKITPFYIRDSKKACSIAISKEMSTLLTKRGFKLSPEIKKQVPGKLDLEGV